MKIEKSVWVLLDRKKRKPILLYLCAFSSPEDARFYAEDRGLGELGYGLCELKIKLRSENNHA